MCDDGRYDGRRLKLTPVPGLAYIEANWATFCLGQMSNSHVPKLLFDTVDMRAASRGLHTWLITGPKPYYVLKYNRPTGFGFMPDLNYRPTSAK